MKRILNLYNIGDATRLVSTYLATCALYAGSVMMGGPSTLIAGAALSTVLINHNLKHGKEWLESHLQAYGESHIHSPNLRHIVNSLYTVSGLKPDKHPIYKFKPKELSAEERLNLGSGKEKLYESFKQASLMPNAAASNLTKPVIIISEPLLQLLEDEEEHAVLAHEFVHASAKHQSASIPMQYIASAAQISNLTVKAIEFLKTGFIGVPVSILAGAWTAKLYSAIQPFKEMLAKDFKPKDVDEQELSKDLKRDRSIWTKLATVFTASIFNPSFAGVYVATSALNKGLSFTVQKLSRNLEYQADRSSVTKFGANPLALITALRKIELLIDRSQRNAVGFAASDIKKTGLTKLWAELASSHPSTENRIEQLAKLAHKSEKFAAEEIEQAVHGDLQIGDVPDLPLELAQAIALQFHIHSATKREDENQVKGQKENTLADYLDIVLDDNRPIPQTQQHTYG